MSADQEFDSFVKDFFENTVKEHPVIATYLGIHTYDHMLPEVSRESMYRRIAMAENYLDRLHSIDKSALTGERKYDYDIAEMFLEFWIFWYKELRFWEKDPDYVGLLGEAIYPLFSRRFAPPEKRAEKIVARLNASEEFLKQAKTCIILPVRLWTEIALETCQRMPNFVNLVSNTMKNMVSESLGKELEESSKKAVKAIKEYEEWLKDAVLPRAIKNFAITKEQYDKLVQIRRLGLSTEQILSLGEKYLSEFKQQLKEIANQIKPGATIEEAKEIVKSKHPQTFDEALKVYKEAMEKAKKFIIEHAIATIPPEEKLEIIETPTFLRHIIPFAAYDPPAPFDKDQTGRYMVTPIENKPEMLKEHNYASIMNTTVHEGYPGHHLQLVCANKHPSLIRHLASLMSFIGTETIEGYAHWVEEYMSELGYEDTPETRFVRTLDMLWRAVRIIVDIKLCTGQISFDEAVEMLVRETGMERPAAIAEVKRYTSTPTQPLSYLIGKHLIKQLREEVKKKMGEKYTDKFFIDTILYSGSAPYFVLKRIFEEKMKQQLQEPLW